MSRLHSGHARQKNTPAHLRTLQVFCPLLDAHPARDFAHGDQQRQSAVLVAEGFVSHGNASGVEQIFGQFPISGKMEISEHDLPAPQQRQFTRLRLFHLDDHFRAAVNFLGPGNHFGAMAEVILIKKSGAQTCARFDQHFMSAAG